MEVTVNQLAKDESEVKTLKVGQLTEDGLGMIFWVDPDNQEAGKAISLERWGGNPFEASIKLHNAFSTINGIEWGMDSMSTAAVKNLDAKCVLAMILGAVRAEEG